MTNLILNHSFYVHWVVRTPFPTCLPIAHAPHFPSAHTQFTPRHRPPRLLLLQPACIKDRRPTRRWDCGESTVSAARPQARPLRLAVGAAAAGAAAVPALPHPARPPPTKPVASGASGRVGGGVGGASEGGRSASRGEASRAARAGGSEWLKRGEPGGRALAAGAMAAGGARVGRVG